MAGVKWKGYQELGLWVGARPAGWSGACTRAAVPKSNHCWEAGLRLGVLLVLESRCSLAGQPAVLCLCHQVVLCIARAGKERLQAGL